MKETMYIRLHYILFSHPYDTATFPVGSGVVTLV